MGMSSILLFVIYPYRFRLFQHLIDIPGFFGIFSAVWVVDFQSAILQSGKNDKMTVAGKLTKELTKATFKLVPTINASTIETQ